MSNPNSSVGCVAFGGAVLLILLLVVALGWIVAASLGS